MVNITEQEFETNVYPQAYENWHDAHGLLDGERPLADAEVAEISAWAVVLRNSYETGEFPISWR